MPRRQPSTAIIPIDRVQQRILHLRSQRVIIDVELASLNGVPTKRLNEQVKCNSARFRADYMFRLTLAEKREVVANCDLLQSLKFSSQLPYAFTEHGAIIAANVLIRERAVSASLFVVLAFVKLRELLASHHQLAGKFDKLERKFQDHDGQIIALIDAIRQLMEEPEEPAKPPIGFLTEISGPRKTSPRKK